MMLAVFRMRALLSLLLFAAALGCSSSRPAGRAPSPSLQQALAPMAAALAEHAPDAGPLMLVRADRRDALTALSKALERELAARGVRVSEAASPPAGSYVLLSLRERRGEDPALIAEAFDTGGERADLIAAYVPRAVLEELTAPRAGVVKDGLLERRDLGTIPFDALDVLLLSNPPRCLLASSDSVLLVPLPAPAGGSAAVSAVERTLPPSRDPSAILFREEGGVITLLTNADSSAASLDVSSTNVRVTRVRDLRSAGLRGPLSPVSGRGYFVSAPADSAGAGPPLEIYDLARGDFDGDGLEETAVARVGEQVWVVSDRFPYGAGVDRSGAALAAADLGGTGRDDLVVTAAVAPGEGDSLTVYRWDGVDFGVVGRTNALPGSIIALDAHDADGDGRDEIVAVERRAGEKDVRLHVYELPAAAP